MFFLALLLIVYSIQAILGLQGPHLYEIRANLDTEQGVKVLGLLLTIVTTLVGICNFTTLPLPKRVPVI